MVVRLAFVKFTSDGRKAVRPIDDIKDFFPKSCLDFDQDRKYDVLWELEDGSQEYFTAKILCLASSDADLLAKEKEQKKWRLPSSYVSKNLLATKVLKPAEAKMINTKKEASHNRKAKTESKINASDKRMAQYLKAASVKSKPIAATSHKPEQSSSSAAQSPKVSDDEYSSSEELVSSTKLDEAKAEIARLKKILKASAEKREKAEEEKKKMQEKLNSMEKSAENTNDSRESPQLEAVSQKADDDQRDISISPTAMEILEGELSAKRPSEAEGSNKKKVKYGEVNEDSKMQARVADHIYKDLSNQNRLEKKDGKVNLGNDVYVDAESWSQTRAAKNENAFIAALLRSMWGRRVLAKKTMKGMAPRNSKSPEEKTPLTPKKLNAVLGGLRGYYRNEGVPEKLLDAHVRNGKKVISSKLNDEARWMREVLQKEAQDAEASSEEATTSKDSEDPQPAA